MISGIYLYIYIYIYTQVKSEIYLCIYPATVVVGAAPPKNMATAKRGVLYMPQHPCLFSTTFFLLFLGGFRSAHAPPMLDPVLSNCRATSHSQHILGLFPSEVLIFFSRTYSFFSLVHLGVVV